jgi:hypothetical protein
LIIDAHACTRTIAAAIEADAPTGDSPLMATKKHVTSAPKGKAKPASAHAPAVDKALVKQVSDELTGRLATEAAPPPGVEGATPAGAMAAPGAFGKRFQKLIPNLLSAGLEVAGMARDGAVDEGEARRVGELVLEFVRKVREPAGAAGGPPA